MNSILYTIIWYFENAVLIPAVSAFFFCSVQKPKYKKFLFPLITIGYCVIAEIFLFTDRMSRVAFSSSYNALLIFTAFFMFRDNWRRKLLNTVLHYILVMASDYTCYFTQNRIVVYYTLEKVQCISALFMITCSFLILKITAQFLRSHDMHTLDKSSFIFLLIPVSNIATYFFISYASLGKQYRVEPIPEMLQTPIFTWGMLTCLIASLFADALALRQYWKSLDAERLRSQNEALQYRNEMNERYFEELKDTELEFRKIRHDIGGSLQVVKELIYEEQNTEEARTLFDSLTESVRTIHSGFYCSNSIVNAILTSKNKQCQSSQIEFEASIQVPNTLWIEESDLCRVLVNLLDNAIEANAVSEEKFVRITMRTENDYLYIKTENPYSGQDYQSSTKKDKSSHGLGLRILKDLAQKYDGVFNISNDDCTTQTVLTLCNKKSE